MANLGLNAAQSLPRFLLPKLSWQAAPNHQIRTISSAVSSYNGLSNRNTPSSRVSLQQRAKKELVLAKPNTLQNAVYRRPFHATARRARDHHFDTLKFVQRLQEEGFTEAQSVAMMKVLSDVIEERLVLQYLYLKILCN